MRGWTLRQRVTALCVAVGLLLGALAVAEAAVAARNRGAVDNLLTKVGPLRTDGQTLAAALLDQETGVRGYAVTGDRADLAPYDEGVAEQERLTGQMSALLDGYPSIRRELEAVGQRAERWRQAVAAPVIAATQTQGTAAAQLLLTDESRRLFDEVRVALTQLQDSILTLRQEIAEQTRSTGNALVALLIVAALVVLLAGAALLLSLDRMVIRPLTGLAEQVRGVAKGDYQREISGVGPPELARLAADVDAMRRRIAADLAEVREARERIEWVNNQLQKQAEELVRSNRDLEQFAYVASHDLQEPLRKVASFCQLLQRRYAGQLDERADQYIAFAVDGAQRMQRLINDLLAFSRIGRLTTGFTEVDLGRVMSEVAGQTEAARQYADGELTWSDLPVVRGEEPLLTNLLANLVSNSVKFRRPDVPPRVHVSARRVGDEWEITCQDNGIGIEPEFADKIFVIFQRLHSKDAYPGTGIGLAIAKKIVEYHGGRVWVDTDVERQGATIRFTLPVLAEQAGEPEGSDAADGGATAPAADGGATAPAADAPAGTGDAAHPEGSLRQRTGEAGQDPVEVVTGAVGATAATGAAPESADTGGRRETKA
jgi:signal transduction histidine kinase